MQHDWEIDLLLGSIVSKIRGNLFGFVTMRHSDPAQLDGYAADHPEANFFRMIARQRPASVKAIFDKHSPENLDKAYADIVSQFHSMTALCDFVPNVANMLCRDIDFETFHTGDYFYDPELDPDDQALFSEHYYAHGALIAKIEYRGEPQLFLIDPTFRQFDFYLTTMKIHILIVPH